MPSSTTPSTRTYMSPKTEKPKSNNDKPAASRQKKKYLPWVIIVVLLIACAFLFLQYRNAQANLNGNAQNEKYQAKLQKLILVPSNETPTIATVKDTGKLSGQAFFKSAQNGDKVFVYSSLKKAILYRPSTNMIINVEPINVNSAAPNSNTN